MKKGEINLGSGAFRVTDAGILTMSKGSISLGSGAFSVTDAGVLTMTKGSISLGGGVFAVTNTGALTCSDATITGGSLTIGSNFSVTNSGAITAKTGTIGPWSISTSAFTGTFTGGTVTMNTDGLFFNISGNEQSFVGRDEIGFETGVDYYNIIDPYVTFLSPCGRQSDGDSKDDIYSLHLSRPGTHRSRVGVQFGATHGYFELAHLISGEKISTIYASKTSLRLRQPEVSDVYTEIELEDEVLNLNCYDPTSGEQTQLKLEPDKMTLNPHRFTTSHTGNLYINGDDVVYWANEGGSSRKIKRDIEPISESELDPERLYDVEVVQFKYKDDFLDEDDENRDRILPGFIVEDLDQIYPAAVQKDSEESRFWTWSPYRMIPAMLKLIQDQHEEIEDLKRRLS